MSSSVASVIPIVEAFLCIFSIYNDSLRILDLVYTYSEMFLMVVLTSFIKHQLENLFQNYIESCEPEEGTIFDF